VTISVISLLAAILLPALRGARQSARQTVCLSNLRGLSITLEHYQRASRDTFPFARESQQILVSPEGEDPAAYISGSHFDLSLSWIGLMHDVAPWREYFRSWICPGSDRDPGRPWVNLNQGSPVTMSSYLYCYGLYARPEVWEPGAAANPALLAPVRSFEVSFPAAKVVMFDSEAAHREPRSNPDPPRPALFIDGHVVARRLSDASRAVPNPFNGSSVPLLNTLHGCHGRDY
jgi:hypothetical protein